MNLGGSKYLYDMLEDVQAIPHYFRIQLLSPQRLILVEIGKISRGTV